MSLTHRIHKVLYPVQVLLPSHQKLPYSGVGSPCRTLWSGVVNGYRDAPSNVNSSRASRVVGNELGRSSITCRPTGSWNVSRTTAIQIQSSGHRSYWSLSGGSRGRSDEEPSDSACKQQQLTWKTVFKKVSSKMALHSTTSKKFPIIENGVYPECLTYSDGELLQKVLDIVKKEKLYGKVDEYKKVVDFRHPEELSELLELPMCRSGCRTRGEVDEVLERVVRHSVRTQHPHFYNQLYGGIDEVGLAGAWLLEAINTNQHTYEVGPALVVAEYRVVEQLVKLYGWETGDGMFCPGGSIANMYSIVLARHRLNPTLKKTGMFGAKPLVVLTSDQSHYSITKAAFWLGIGTDNVVAVPTDSEGVMNGEALLETIKRLKLEGKQPFYVNATAGTTVFGSFDSFNEIADICKSENIWFHVDACWGGAAILSSKHKHLLEGTERADSLSWNPHKMLCIPLQCSVLLVKEKGLLHQANCVGASYLFQQDKFYDVSYDTGDKSIQCGRKGDALKLWLTFKIHGMDVLERRIDAAFEASKYLEEEIVRREGFELVRENLPCTNVCFWYLPPALRDEPRTVQWWQKMDKVAPLIKEKLVVEGTLLIGYQPMLSKGLVNFFRMVNTSHPVPSPAHMNYVLDEIERRGKILQLEQLE